MAHSGMWSRGTKQETVSLFCPLRNQSCNKTVFYCNKKKKNISHCMQSEQLFVGGPGLLDPALKLFLMFSVVHVCRCTSYISFSVCYSELGERLYKWVTAPHFFFIWIYKDVLQQFKRFLLLLFTHFKSYKVSSGNFMSRSTLWRLKVLIRMSAWVEIWTLHLVV